ncbi:hypothetical protein [Acetobacter sp. DsW_063]|uniref:hypothetical protein n=1 Tax=Acetobacter sp. DsW_063 TaxID=1514894 RepID=UPI000A3B9C8A|nr:hypothetical protein [Acetobacter sp. DsW_063]OUJ14542.1 hypothetical protein HK28_13070 [Acetobacter sp. DsW_063]
MRRLVLLVAIVVLHLSSVAHAQLPTSVSVTSGAGVSAETLSRIDDSRGTMLVFKVGDEREALTVQGEALDALLGKMIAHRALPDSFSVRLAGSRTGLIRQLQDELLRPDANWNVDTGQPGHGALQDVLTGELNSVLKKSPVANAFARHGYGLTVEGLEHIEEDPGSFPKPYVRVPTDILVMEITAGKEASK